MFNPEQIGIKAAQLHKEAVKVRQGRSGRTMKGDNMKKHLHAAGKPKMDTPGVFAFARGRSV